MPLPSIDHQLLRIGDTLHARLMALAMVARESGNSWLATEIEDCKLQLANQITAVILQVQIEAMTRHRQEPPC